MTRKKYVMDVMDKNDTLTDYELVKLYEAGNNEAFDVLLKRYQQQVYTYLLFMTKNEAKAEDMLQETFEKAIVAIRSHKYQTTGKFSAWLTRIAHNIVIDGTRDMQSKRIVTRDEFSQGILNDIRLSEESHEKDLIEAQQSDMLMQILNYLPDVQREVVLMRFYEGKSFKEIAEATDVSINTSLGRMRYALINLRKLLNGRNLALVG